MVAAPSITLTVTPPGGSPSNYEQYLAYSGHASQFTITQNFGRQGDTATFPLVDEYDGTPNYFIPAMSQVRLHDGNCHQTLFAGVASDPSLSVSGVNRNEWTLNCTDYTQYANAATVHGTFNGFSTDQVVIDLTRQANCGITAASVRDGGFVAPGPVMANFVLNYCSLSDAWRKLAVLAGAATPYGWYVDDTLNLHFYDASTAVNSGVTFTTTPTVSGSTTQGHILLDGQDKYEWDATSLYNRVLVQGATQNVNSPVSGPATDTWYASGFQQAWPLRYTLNGTPTLHLNGVRTLVTTVTPGTAVPPSGWSSQQNASGQYFLFSASAPPAGTLLQAWYSYQVPVVAQATDFSSVRAFAGPNGGIFSEFISDTTLTTTPMALLRAQQERSEYAFPVERFTFSTSEDFLGWVRAGYTCTVDDRFAYDTQSNSWGVRDTFLVIANQVTFGMGGYRQMQVTAVRLLPDTDADQGRNAPLRLDLGAHPRPLARPLPQQLPGLVRVISPDKGRRLAGLPGHLRDLGEHPERQRAARDQPHGLRFPARQPGYRLSGPVAEAG